MAEEQKKEEVKEEPKKDAKPEGTEEAVAAAEPAKKETPVAPATLRVILGQKVGMTQIYAEDGNVVPVTVVQAGPCTILNVKTKDKDGYEAVQLGFGAVKEKNLTKPQIGQFKKWGQAPVRWVREVRVPKLDGLEAGQAVTLTDRFAPGDYIDVQGTSKGKGFASVIKRHNFSGLPASHGASDKERSPGSIASRRSLGKVISGQRMAGHMGAERVSVLKLEVAAIDAEKNQILIKGAIPGPRKGDVIFMKETTRPQKKKVITKKPTKKRKGKK